MYRTQWIPLTCTLAAIVAWVPASADHTLPQRLRQEAQVQSNNGHFTEARQLRAIADGLKDKDAGLARQVQSEVSKGNLDKAMDLLKVR